MTNMQSNYGLDPNLTITCPLNQWPSHVNSIHLPHIDSH